MKPPKPNAKSKCQTDDNYHSSSGLDLSSSRRSFLRSTGLGVGIVTVSGVEEVLGSSSIDKIPPHLALRVPGVHAYANKQSLFAGDTISFHVSSTVPYRMEVVRLGYNLDAPNTDFVIQSFEPSPARSQPIHPGSYAFVSRRLKHRFQEFSLECWIRPWNLSALQGVITQEDKEASTGFALGIGKDGYVGFFVGDGISSDEAVIHRTPVGVLKIREWSHLVAVWNGHLKQIWVNGVMHGEWKFKGTCVPGQHPLRIGAMGERGIATRFFDGDISMPSIYSKALSSAEITARFKDKALSRPPQNHLYACWPLNEEKGDRIHDISQHRRHGKIINHATWMIGGPSFHGEKVMRFGDYDPRNDPARGHGLRFASDDLYDCRWDATQLVRIPARTKAGIHVARIHFNQNGEERRYDVTFLVRGLRTRRKPPVLVICSTSTWTAYNAVPFGEWMPDGTFLGTEGFKNSRDGAPAYSCYRNHQAGQPAYHFGLRMPWPCAAPYVLYSSKATGYSHLMRGERFLHVWLEKEGYPFDLASDLDLHQNPNLLQSYKTVFINGHSEYWSVKALDGLEQYLKNGGTGIVLSGNTMFWRTTFNSNGSVMECRKYDERIGGRAGAPIGELFHSEDGQRGSLLRECGYPAWKFVGLECSGWGDVESQSAGIYHVSMKDHFLFQTPERIDWSDGDTFGHSLGGKSHRAVGHEYDVRLSTLKKITHSIPEGAHLPNEEPAGIVTLAQGKRGNPSALDYFTQPTTTQDGILAEMIYWERPQGGKIFHAGAIGAGWALSVDPKLQALIRNVLHNFGIKRPTKMRGQ